METMNRNGTVTLTDRAVWDVVNLYRRKAQQGDGIDRLEALAHVFADTLIGDEVATVWADARGTV